MKGNTKLIVKMNELLASEFAAIHQYGAHMAILENWGYSKLANYIKEHLDDERKHAKMLMDRIAFYDSLPSVASLDLMINTSMEIPKQFEFDLAGEMKAIKGYTEGIQLALEAGDHVTRQMFEDIIKDEDHHVDEIESYQTQIKQMTLGVFLSSQN